MQGRFRFSSLIRLALAGVGLALAARAVAGRSDHARDRAMPSDSVLARVGEARIVTVAEFRRAWAETAPPTRPDSLTPQGARRFLDLLLDREILTEQALREPWRWSAAESLRYTGLGDRLALAAALDSVLAEIRAARRARGQAELEPLELGIAARESVTARIAPSFDDSLVGRVARAFARLPQPSSDSSLASQLRTLSAMPRVDAADLAGVLARSSVGAYRVSDLLDSWRRLPPTQRPRVRAREDLRALVENGLFERWLRERAIRQGLGRSALVAARLQRERESIALSHLLEHEVTRAIRPDSAALAGYYHEHSHAFDLPEGIDLIRLVLPDRRAASAMAVRLGDAAEAESLVARARRSGVDYRDRTTRASDPALFEAATRAGPGHVLGPDSVAQGWQVARVVAIALPRPRGFAEVRDEVESHYVVEESERRTRSLIERLRRETRITIDGGMLRAVIGSSTAARAARP